MRKWNTADDGGHYVVPRRSRTRAEIPHRCADVQNNAVKVGVWARIKFLSAAQGLVCTVRQCDTTASMGSYLFYIPMHQYSSSNVGVHEKHELQHFWWRISPFAYFLLQICAVQRAKMAFVMLIDGSSHATRVGLHALIIKWMNGGRTFSLRPLSHLIANCTPAARLYRTDRWVGKKSRKKLFWLFGDRHLSSSKKNDNFNVKRSKFKVTGAHGTQAKDSLLSNKLAFFPFAENIAFNAGNVTYQQRAHLTRST